MIYLEDFQVSQKIITRGRTVTEADIVMFAALSGDWYGIHVDAELAKKPFSADALHMASWYCQLPRGL